MLFRLVTRSLRVPDNKSHLSLVRWYFDSVASHYQEASNGRIWRVVRRMEARAVQESLGSLQGKNVIELGCGSGFYTRLLLEMGARHVLAVDISPEMLRGLQMERVTPIMGDVAKFTTDRSFEVLLAAGVLEFVPDPEAVLRNAALFALPNARFVILYPTANLLALAYWLYHRRHGFHINLFRHGSICRLAKATGWSVADIRQSGPFSACARLIRSGPI
jgi:ubiquinone/menaquinone biosynthesis C-methylase UbiE